MGNTCKSMADSLIKINGKRKEKKKDCGRSMGLVLQLHAKTMRSCSARGNVAPSNSSQLNFSIFHHRNE